MPKVYKRKSSKKKSLQLPHGWGNLLIGLIIGLAIGYVAYIYKTKVSQPGAAQVSSEPKSAKPSAKTQTNTTPEPAKSRFDFYTLLPEMEVIIPDIDESSGANQRLAKTDKKEVYVIQTGSFRRLDEADSHKANLALMGIEAKIQTVAINGEDTWYRVRLGPFSDYSQLRQARSRLRQNNIEFIVLKMNVDDN